ncbi:MAG: hypothetical protein FJ128_05605 [Deltaproteobacteria bacterium]|nr:hypothetical protein [Deltaproteobacteria bacterium]
MPTLRPSRDFRCCFPDLAAGDLLLGVLPLRPGEEVKLLDLLERGVGLFPPALAQLLSRSKAAQAEVLGAFMLPGTVVARTPAELARLVSEPLLRGPVVTKRDQAHLGLGVGLWPSLEALLSLSSLGQLPFPLVIQPFAEGVRDLRVVLAGEAAEAYERSNPFSFRKNLFQGGSSQSLALSPSTLAFCRRVMDRGRFPYAILDLLASPGGGLYLSEIGLKGGLTGSRLGQEGFRAQVQRLEEEFCRTWAGSSTTPI